MSSDPYLYPGTSVLRNHRGLRDKEKLSSFEQQEAALAIRDLRKAPVSGDFDYAHLREIHRRIFQDVYPFAGETCQMDMTKNERILAGASVAYSYADDITRDAALHLKEMNGNYMRKCASGGQSLANAERGVEMCGFVGKIDTEFFITNVHLYIIIGNPGPNILVAHFRM